MKSKPTHSEWQNTLRAHPEAHLLQTEAWGKLKADFGWSYHTLSTNNTGALILVRSIFPGLKLAYIPKGPIGEWLSDLLPRIHSLCNDLGVFMLKIEPDSRQNESLQQRLEQEGFIRSPHTVQPPRTIKVDLRDEEDDLLMRMKSKTRYNIRLAGRKGVEVSTWSDIAAFADMMEETADRDEFGAHDKAYFRKAYDLFHPSGACELFVAEVDSLPVAAIMVFKRGGRAWYLYGASRSVHREKMPTYALQWEAMRWA
ncbi:MAG: peptidoglycan bridge formation glycyltransferase FemA/FemB family protein, partial [Anaerolineales bacterium]|nr:peptidoglycan bridge formation glycyltransferase FemA/FemB family protein [Anaerolineales bacterium]